MKFGRVVGKRERIAWPRIGTLFLVIKRVFPTLTARAAQVEPVKWLVFPAILIIDTALVLVIVLTVTHDYGITQ